MVLYRNCRHTFAFSLCVDTGKPHSRPVLCNQRKHLGAFKAPVFPLSGIHHLGISLDWPPLSRLCSEAVSGNCSGDAYDSRTILYVYRHLRHKLSPGGYSGISVGDNGHCPIYLAQFSKVHSETGLDRRAALCSGCRVLRHLFSLAAPVRHVSGTVNSAQQPGNTTLLSYHETFTISACIQQKSVL